MGYNNVVIFTIFACLVLSGCATLTGYQDGKTLTEGVSEINVSINIGQSQIFEVDNDNPLDIFNRIFFPNIEVSYRRGMTERLDVIGRFNTVFNVGAGCKYQLIGNAESNFAVSSGAEIHNFGFLTSGLWNIQLPLYTSIHPTDRFTIYCTPRYIHQFSTFRGYQNWRYTGGNIGIIVGQSNNFMFDIGYYRMHTKNTSSVSLISFGAGGRFILSGKKENTPEKTSRKKKK